MIIMIMIIIMIVMIIILQMMYVYVYIYIYIYFCLGVHARGARHVAYELVVTDAAQWMTPRARVAPLNEVFATPLLQVRVCLCGLPAHGPVFYDRAPRKTPLV